MLFLEMNLLLVAWLANFSPILCVVFLCFVYEFLCYAKDFFKLN